MASHPGVGLGMETQESQKSRKSKKSKKKSGKSLAESRAADDPEVRTIDEDGPEEFHLRGIWLGI